MADKKKAGEKPAVDRDRKSRPSKGGASSSRSKTAAPTAASPAKKKKKKTMGKSAAKRVLKVGSKKGTRNVSVSRRRGPDTVPPPAEVLSPGPPGLSEEDAIRSAKYLPRNLPPRLFEEERFLFPESYGMDRVRLLVRDPDWLFAYWDVSEKSIEGLRRTLGERAAAVARLTLRISDPVSGGQSDVLLPAGARWWYVRTDSARRSYRAELGFTVASGEFRSLAASNTVTTPRVGPSAEKAKRRLSYRQAGEIPPAAGVAVSLDEMRSASGNEPWTAPDVDGAAEPGAPKAPGRARKGGASDAFSPGGASDVHRR